MTRKQFNPDQINKELTSTDFSESSLPKIVESKNPADINAVVEVRNEEEAVAIAAPKPKPPSQRRDSSGNNLTSQDQVQNHVRKLSVAKDAQAPALDMSLLEESYAQFCGIAHKASMCAEGINTQLENAKNNKSNLRSKVKELVEMLEQMREERDIARRAKEMEKKQSKEAMEKVTQAALMTETKLSRQVNEMATEIQDLNNSLAEKQVRLDVELAKVSSCISTIESTRSTIHDLKDEVARYERLGSIDQDRINQRQLIDKVKESVWLKLAEAPLSSEDLKQNMITSPMDVRNVESMEDFVNILYHGMSCLSLVQGLMQKADGLQFDLSQTQKHLEEVQLKQQHLEANIREIAQKSIWSPKSVASTSWTIRECLDEIASVTLAQESTQKLAQKLFPMLPSDISLPKCLEGFEAKVNELKTNQALLQKNCDQLTEQNNQMIEEKMQLEAVNENVGSEMAQLKKQMEELRKQRKREDGRLAAVEEVMQVQRWNVEREKLHVEVKRIKTTWKSHFLERDRSMIELVQRHIHLIQKSIDPQTSAFPSFSPVVIQSIAECVSELNKLKDFIVLSSTRILARLLSQEELEFSSRSLLPTSSMKWVNPVHAQETSSSVTNEDDNVLTNENDMLPIHADAATSMQKKDMFHLQLTDVQKAVQTLAWQYEQQIMKLKTKLVDFQALQHAKYEEVLNLVASHVLQDACADAPSQAVMELHQALSALKVRLSEALFDRDRLLLEAELNDSRFLSMASQHQETQRVMNGIITELQQETHRLREDMLLQWQRKPLYSDRALQHPASASASATASTAASTANASAHHLLHEHETKVPGFLSLPIVQREAVLTVENPTAPLSSPRLFSSSST